jgi:hypothetical protein
VGATDGEVVGEGTAAGADWVAVEVWVRVTVRSGWVGADVSSRSDDLVSSGSGWVGADVSSRSDDLVSSGSV